MSGKRCTMHEASDIRIKTIACKCCLSCNRKHTVRIVCGSIPSITSRLCLFAESVNSALDELRRSGQNGHWAPIVSAKQALLATRPSPGLEEATPRSSYGHWPGGLVSSVEPESPCRKPCRHESSTEAHPQRLTTPVGAIPLSRLPSGSY
jgi:hypothetical protein